MPKDNDRKLFDIAQLFVDNVLKSADDMDANQLMSETLNALNFKDTGRLVLILATRLAVLEDMIGVKLAPEKLPQDPDSGNN